MKTVKSMLLAFLLLGLGAAAGHAQDPIPANTNPFSTIKIETRCEAMVDNACLGRFGFAVDSQGNFTAGPDPSGKTAQGVITPTELESLANSIVELNKSEETLGCKPQGAIPGAVLHISVVYAADGKKADIFFSARQAHFRVQGNECLGGPLQKERAVRAAVSKLLAKYYPVPFSTGS